MADQVKIVGMVTTDERFTPAETKPAAKGDPAGPYVFVATAQGQVLRTPLSAYRTASTKSGRRFVRLEEGDRVVIATLQQDEDAVVLVSRGGHVLHFDLEEVNVLAGVGKGVIGIKLEDGDLCLGGAAMGKARPSVVVETSDGKTMDFGRRAERVSRGGKGYEAVKRRTFTRVVPGAIELTDWEAQEVKDAKAERKNGPLKGLYE